MQRVVACRRIARMSSRVAISSRVGMQAGVSVAWHLKFIDVCQQVRGQIVINT